MERHQGAGCEDADRGGADVNARLTNGKGGLGKYNTKDATPFLMASATADVPYLRLLLELGANPSLANEEFEMVSILNNDFHAAVPQRYTITNGNAEAEGANSNATFGVCVPHSRNRVHHGGHAGHSGCDRAVEHGFGGDVVDDGRP